jgi:RNA polymerase primary sigma factor
MGNATVNGNRRRNVKADTSLAIYLRQIENFSVLSRTEEHFYACRAREGDQLAREKLIKANLRIVVKVAKEFHSRSLPLEDIISEGNIGLMNAIERFDPERGTRLLSYAVWWIRQSILRAMNEKSRIIHLPRGKAGRLLRIVQEGENHFDMHFGDLQKTNRPGNHCGLSSELANMPFDVLSFDAPFKSFEEGSWRLLDFIEDKKGSRPEEILMTNSLRENIDTVLSSLSQKELEILQHRFGLNGKSRMTLKSIGTKYRLTAERIRQIEKEAIERLRHPSSADLLRNYRYERIESAIV